MRIYSQTFSTLLIALCLQACVGGKAESTKLGVKKPSKPRCPESVTQDSTTQVREVPWQGELEEREWYTPPLLGGMQQPSGDEKVRVESENKAHTQSISRIDTSTSGQRSLTASATRADFAALRAQLMNLEEAHEENDEVRTAEHETLLARLAQVKAGLGTNLVGIASGVERVEDHTTQLLAHQRRGEAQRQKADQKHSAALAAMHGDIKALQAAMLPKPKHHAGNYGIIEMDLGSVGTSVSTDFNDALSPRSATRAFRTRSSLVGAWELLQAPYLNQADEKQQSDLKHGRGAIVSTQAFVQALNGPQSSDKKALKKLLQQYNNFFVDWKWTDIEPADFIEYSTLARVQASSDVELLDLLRRYVEVWRSKLDEGYNKRHITAGIEQFLTHIDERAFGGDPTLLIELSESLLEQLPDDKSLYTRATYGSHVNKLRALERALEKIRAIAADKWTPGNKAGIYYKLKTKLAEIQASSYYPIQYQAKLVAQNLVQLKAPPSKQQALGKQALRAYYALKGLAQVAQSIASTAPSDVDFENFEQGLVNIVAAYTGNTDPALVDRDVSIQHIGKLLATRALRLEGWYVHTQLLLKQALDCLIDEPTFAQRKKQVAHQGSYGSYLARTFEGYEKQREEWLALAARSGEALCALQYSLVQQTALLLLTSPDEAIHKQCVAWLKSKLGDASWHTEPAVVQEILAVLHRAATLGRATEVKEAVEALVKAKGADWPTTQPTCGSTLFACGTSKPRVESLQESYVTWRATQQRPLEAERKTAQAAQATGRLFRKVKEQIERDENVKDYDAKIRQDQQFLAEQKRCWQAQRTLYNSDAHVWVQDFLDSNRKWSIAESYIQLVIVERDGKRNQQPAHEARDQLLENYETIHAPKRAIQLADIPKLLAHRRAAGPRRALLIGRAGIGKTTVCKRLTHLWAAGKWGQNFEAVYLLSVRLLNSYQGVHDLAHAIARSCFADGPTLSEEALKARRSYIIRQLAERGDKVLLILDGLDEASERTKTLLQQARGSRYRDTAQIWVSRPYGISPTDRQGAVEIENIGFSNDQVEAYVQGYFEEEDKKGQAAKTLLQYMESSPNIRGVAHIPINLQILCNLWRSHDRTAVEEAGGSLTLLYDLMAQKIWKRFEKSDRQVRIEDKVVDIKDDRRKVSKLLGRIALAGLLQAERQVLIDEALIEAQIEAAVEEEFTEDNHRNGKKALRELLGQSGFLRATDGNKSEFLHLTFQEYFAGTALAHRFLSENADKRQVIEAFARAQQYRSENMVTLSFMAGAVYQHPERGGLAGIQQLLETLNDAAQEAVGLQHFLLQLLCVNQCLGLGLSAAEEEALEKQYHLQGQLQRWIRLSLARIQQRSQDTATHEALLEAIPRLQHYFKREDIANVYVAAIKKDASSWVVRAATARALAVITKVAPSRAPVVLQPLLELFNKVGNTSEEMNLTEFCSGPVIMHATLDILKTMSKTTLEGFPFDVRAILAAHFSGRLLETMLESAPALAKQVIRPCLEACDDENVSRSADARAALEKAATVAPGDTFKELKMACSRGRVAVRATAVRTLGKFPRPEVLKLLGAALQDKAQEVRIVAMEALPPLVAAHPKLTSKAFPLLQQACTDASPLVRIAAMEALPTFASASTGTMDTQLQKLLAACYESEQHIGVRTALTQALAAMEQHAQLFLEPLLKACTSTPQAEKQLREASEAYEDMLARLKTDQLMEFIVSQYGKLRQLSSTEQLTMVVAGARLDQETPPKEHRDSTLKAMSTLGQYGASLGSVLATVREMRATLEAMPQLSAATVQQVAAYEQNTRALHYEALSAEEIKRRTQHVVRLDAEFCKNSNPKIVRVKQMVGKKAMTLLPSAAAQQHIRGHFAQIPSLLKLGRDVVVGMRTIGAPAVNPAAAFQQLAVVCERTLQAQELHLASVRALSKVLQSMNAQAAEATIDKLIQKLPDAKEEAHHIAEVLATLAQAVPQCALKPLVAACGGNKATVREAALVAFGVLCKAAPGCISQALAPLHQALKQAKMHPQAAVAAIEAAERIVRVAPQYAVQLRAPLLSAYSQGDKKVRAATMRTLEVCIQAAPHHMQACAEVLLKGSQDKAVEVRRATIGALGAFARTAHSTLAIKALLRACSLQEKEVFVRDDAALMLEQIGPDKHQEILAQGGLSVLLKACTGREKDEFVRSAVAAALEVLIKVAPTQHSLEVLLQACIQAGKEATELRFAVSNAMASYPTAQFVELYGSSPAVRPELLPYLLARLHAQALVIEGQHVTLYQTVGQPTVWQPGQLPREGIKTLQEAVATYRKTVISDKRVATSTQKDTKATAARKHAKARRATQ